MNVIRYVPNFLTTCTYNHTIGIFIQQLSSQTAIVQHSGYLRSKFDDCMVDVVMVIVVMYHVAIQMLMLACCGLECKHCQHQVACMVHCQFTLQFYQDFISEYNSRVVAS